jgi:hypothetical protein
LLLPCSAARCTRSILTGHASRCRCAYSHQRKLDSSCHATNDTDTTQKLSSRCRSGVSETWCKCRRRGLEPGRVSSQHNVPHADKAAAVDAELEVRLEGGVRLRSGLGESTVALRDQP